MPAPPFAATLARGDAEAQAPDPGRRGATEVRVAFDSPERRHLRTISPLWLACALLLAGAVAELIILDPPGPWALVLPLLPLLAPRAPLAAAVGLAVTVCAASAADMLATYATTPDFVASLTLLVIGAFATPRRAVAGLVIVEAGMLAALAADEMAWPTVS